MGKDPDAIRLEIEHTREHMGDTVEAISYKADVKTRTKEWVDEKTEGLRGTASRVRGSSERMGSKVSDALPDTEDIKQGGRRAVSTAESNPIGLAIGAMAAGFLAGMAFPRTRVEDEKIGPKADQVKQQAAELGQEALERGKSVAQETVESATAAARSEGERQAQELKQSAQSRAPELREGV
jgi:Protein of unknown function (DUF3618)